MPDTLPVIADVTYDVPPGVAEGGGEVSLEKISDAIEKLRKALQPTMKQPPAGGLELDSVEVGLAVTVGGEVGIITKGTFEVSASITVTFARAQARRVGP